MFSFTISLLHVYPYFPFVGLPLGLKVSGPWAHYTEEVGMRLSHCHCVIDVKKKKKKKKQGRRGNNDGGNTVRWQKLVRGPAA